MTSEIEVEIPSVEITLTGPQLDRIWQTLSLTGKGTAIATVLCTYE